MVQTIDIWEAVDEVLKLVQDVDEFTNDANNFIKGIQYNKQFNIIEHVKGKRHFDNCIKLKSKKE